jgi:hypothetical protein
MDFDGNADAAEAEPVHRARAMLHRKQRSVPGGSEVALSELNRPGSAMFISSPSRVVGSVFVATRRVR